MIYLNQVCQTRFGHIDNFIYYTYIYKTSHDKLYLRTCVFDKLDLNCAYALKLDCNIMFYEAKRFISSNKIFTHEFISYSDLQIFVIKLATESLTLVSIWYFPTTKHLHWSSKLRRRSEKLRWSNSKIDRCGIVESVKTHSRKLLSILRWMRPKSKSWWQKTRNEVVTDMNSHHLTTGDIKTTFLKVKRYRPRNRRIQ